MAAREIAVLGAGGHAAVIISTLQANGEQPVAVYDDSEALWGTVVLGVPVRGPICEFATSKFSHAVLGIGDNRARARLATMIDTQWLTVVHPFSWVHPDVPIGDGTVIFAGAIVQPGAEIGSHVILNTKASVDHHCRVGDYCHIAVSHMGGGSSIGHGTFLALGSTVLPGVRIGEWATVGAGAVVTKNVDSGVTVVGVPARPVASHRTQS